jgi:hypothetical protein
VELIQITAGEAKERKKKETEQVTGNTKGDAIQAERTWVAKRNIQRKEMDDDKNGRKTSDSERKTWMEET